MQILFQFWYGYLAKVEHAGSQGGIGMSYGKGIAEMLLASSTTTGDDGYGELFCQHGQSLIGISLFHSVVIHAGEEYLACTSLLCLTGPFEEVVLSALASSLEIATPRGLVAFNFHLGIDGYDTDL